MTLTDPRLAHASLPVLIRTEPFSLDHLLRKVRQVRGVDLSAEDPAPWTPRSLV